MEKAKVIHLGYYHSIDDTRIIHKECRSLYKTGRYALYYITSNRNADVGQFNKDGINEEVIPLINKRFIRLFSYIQDLKKKINALNPQICHIHEFALYPIIPFLRQRGIKIVLDFHENDLDVYKRKIRDRYGALLSNIFYSMMKKYEIKCVRNSDKIIVVDYTLKERIESYGTEAYLIPNYPIVDANNELKLSNLSEDTLCFAGGYSQLWSTENIMKVMEKNPNVTFRLAGIGDDEYINKLKKYHSWERTIFYGNVPFETVINEIYPQSSIGMALLQHDDSWKNGPLGNTKIFEFMMAGIPVVATNFDIWKDIIEKNNCGICVDCNDINAINDAINTILSDRDLARQMGNNGHKLILEKYNWDILAKTLIEIYSELT